jgi:purine-binding chemotaxis protein CheW
VPATSVLELADRLQEPGIAPAAAAVVRVQQFVAFRVGEDEFAIPIASVQEILRVGQITRVPQSPHYICGVTNVRGRLLPVIGVAEFLGRGGRGLDKDSRIVMVELRGRRLGLLVDRATDVLTLPENMIEAAPAEVLGAGMEYIVGVGKRDQRMIFIMDLDRAFGTAS